MTCLRKRCAKMSCALSALSRQQLRCSSATPRELPRLQVLMQMKLTAVRMELRELKRCMPAHRAQASTAGSSTKCAAAEVVKLELLHMLLRLGT